VQKWLFTHGINCLEWPPFSPDLNPIENLWALLKAMVDEQHPRTVDDLVAALQLGWMEITKETCAKYVNSMPTRCKEVLKREGWMTSY
jgi:transposase